MDNLAFASPCPPTPDAVLRHHGDDVLLHLARLGGADAFGELYRRHRDALRRFARSLVPTTPDLAPDLVADAFSNLWRLLLDGAGPQDQPIRYLMVCVRNGAASHHRRTARGERAVRRLAGGYVEQFTAEVADDHLVAAFRSLPDRWRQVLWWTEVEGRSAADVGAELGLSDEGVRALSYRARRALRTAYAPAIDAVAEA